MGYDISFHPISPKEMQEWYFVPLTWVQQGQEEKVRAFAAQQGMEDFYAEKYLNTLRVGAGTGSAFSFLVDEKPEYARYFTPWEQVVPAAFSNPTENRIIENYCSGVYLSPDQAAQLLRDLERNKKVLEDLEELWCDGQLAVLKKALTAAAELGVGLLEATEVVEPNPIASNESTSYSNLYHCDRDGVYLYIDMAIRQIAQAMGKNTDDR